MKIEEMYRKLIETANDAIFIADAATGNILDCNQRACTLLDMSEDEIRGMHQSKLHSPEESERYREIFRRHIREEEAITEPLYVVSRTGENIPVEISANVLDFGGRKLIQGIFRDISERKKIEESLKTSEAKYRLLFTGQRDAVVLIDAETHRIVDVNDSALRLYGYSREEILKLRGADLSAEPEKSKAAIKDIATQTDKYIHYHTRLHKKKDGTVFPVEISSGNFMLHDKKFVSAMIRDITERKKLEEEQQKLQKLESIGILAGGLAHDFNNLLTGILNNVYLSKMDIDRESKEYESLESAEKAILRATNLTQQLLTFSRGGAPIKKTASIMEIIRESAEFALKGSNVKCRYSSADDLWPVEVDEGQINQVLNNLIINASQAMPEGGTIRIHVENANLGPDTGLPLQEGKHAKIILQDQGTGISEEHLKNIFDPYFTTKELGRGLGLSITYSIIKNHDGHILAKSEMGAGTTFTLYLPASEKQSEEKDIAEDPFMKGHGKILLMDDEETIRDAIGSLLRMSGYKIKYAEHGDQALQLYKEAMQTSQPFDAVILDLTVRGGMGGKETIKKMLDIDPNVKAIVSSGYSNDPVMANFKEYGFSDVLPKPCRSPEDLGKILHKLLKK